MTVFMFIGSVQVCANEFYGYYTRFNYTIPIGEANEHEEDEDDYEAEVDLEFMAFEDLPEEVRKEACREYPGQPLMGVEIERDSGQVFYHVMFEVNGAEAGMKMNPQGDILDSWHFGDEGEKEEDETPRRRRRNRSNALTGRYADVVIQVANGQKLIFNHKRAYQPVWQIAKGQWPIADIAKRQFNVGCLYSYARIIENSPMMIKVHWRYMPELKNVGLTTFVQEFFNDHTRR